MWNSPSDMPLSYLLGNFHRCGSWGSPTSSDPALLVTLFQNKSNESTSLSAWRVWMIILATCWPSAVVNDLSCKVFPRLSMCRSTISPRVIPKRKSVSLVSRLSLSFLYTHANILHWHIEERESLVRNHAHPWPVTTLTYSHVNAELAGKGRRWPLVGAVPYQALYVSV